jgi:hypothetical protein
MGEWTEECGGGEEENVNYRASVLHGQWPLHFTMEQALAMQHQPRLIANQAFNGWDGQPRRHRRRLEFSRPRRGADHGQECLWRAR